MNFVTIGELSKKHIKRAHPFLAFRADIEAPLRQRDVTYTKVVFVCIWANGGAEISLRLVTFKQLLL